MSEGSSMSRSSNAYVTRRAQGWPCPHPSRFSMLVVHATYDVMVQVTGVLDGDAVSAFAGCLTAAIADSPRRVVLEVSALEAVDEAGVACFRAAVQEAKAHEVGIVLESPSQVVLARLSGRPGAGVRRSLSGWRSRCVGRTRLRRREEHTWTGTHSSNCSTRISSWSTARSCSTCSTSPP